MRGGPFLTSDGVTSGKIPADVCKGNVSVLMPSFPSVLRTILEIAKVPSTLVGLAGNSYDCW